jgi:flagellar biosynthesis protein FliR
MNADPNTTLAALAIYFGLIFARVGAIVAVMPLFAGRTPMMARVSLALALSIFYFAQVNPEWDATIARKAASLDGVTYATLLIRELLLGAALGFAFNLFLLPARIAGEFISSQIGLAVSPQVGLGGEQPTGPYALIFEAGAAILFLEMNGHHVVIAALHASFDKFPLGGSAFPKPAAEMLRGISTAQELGLLLAGPLALCMFMLSITLAIMTKAAPQLNIYSVGFTLQVFVALGGTLFLLPDLLRLLTVALARMQAAVPGYM